MSQDTEQCRHCNAFFDARLISSAGLCRVCEQRDMEYYMNLNKELDASDKPAVKPVELSKEVIDHLLKGGTIELVMSSTGTLAIGYRP